jgi:hypothetical protein
MEKPYQEFWLWTANGELDLGDEVLDRRLHKEMWTCLRIRNPTLRNQAEHRPVTGQERIEWSDLPVLNLVFGSAYHSDTRPWHRIPID